MQTQAGLVTMICEQWEEARGRGVDLTPEELCRDHPAALDDVRRALTNLLAAAKLADTGPTTDLTKPPEAEPPSTDPDADVLAPAQAPGEIGRLAHYRVLRQLGAGGMGVVFAAEDTTLGRPVALKVMRGVGSANGRARFVREARAAAAVKHDHIVTIYQVGEDRGVPFIALEFLQGMPLDQWMAKNPRPSVAHVVRIARQVADGLAGAHAKGLIHRDIKPANVWLEAPKGRVKILDFGLARAAEDAHLTREGAVVGTPAYMSPEQARGDAVDPRTDLWSLGVMTYRLLAGEQPFKGASTMAVLTALAVDTPAPVREKNPAVPPPLAELIHALLSKDPAGRPASAVEVSNRLRRVEQGSATATAASAPVPDVPPESARRPAAPPPAPPRRRLWVAAGFFLGLIAVVAGVVIVLKGRDGKDTVLNVPDGSVVTVDPEGGATVTRGSKPVPVLPGDEFFAAVTDPAGKWGPAVNLGPAVNSGATDYDLTVSADGLCLVFASFRGGPSRLYECRRASLREPFGPAVRLDMNIEKAGGACPCLSADGLTLLFASRAALPGAQGDGDIYQVRRPSRDAPWGPPVNLGPGVNSNKGEWHSALSPDGLTLVFTSNRSDGRGGVDLWESTRPSADARFGPAANLGPDVNGPGDDNDPRFGPGGRTLLYYRSREGGPRELRAAFRGADGAWASKPAAVPDGHPIGNPIGNHVTPFDNGRAVIFSSSRSGTHGDGDLWEMRRLPDPPAVASPPPAAPGDEFFAAVTDPAGKWGPAVNLGPAANSPSGDYFPTVSADGLCLVFVSFRNGKGELYECRRASLREPFGPAVRLNVNADRAGGSYPCLSADGLTLLFASRAALPGAQGDGDIYQVRRPSRDAPWGPPVNLGPGVNSTSGEWAETMSPDGLTVVISSNRPGGKGSFDLWESTRPSADARFGPAVNLGPDVNGKGSDGDPRFGPGGRTLLYSRKLDDGSSESRVAFRGAGGAWASKPVVLPGSHPSDNDLTPTGDGRAVVFTSRRPGGSGDADLWEMRRLPDGPPADPAFFNGKDLTGWTPDEGEWRVENGELVGTATGSGCMRLWLKRPARDFEMRFEARSRPVGPGKTWTDASLRIRRTPDGRHNVCVELVSPPGRVFRISNWTNYIELTKPPAGLPIATPDVYSTYTVRVQGRRVTVVVNGVTLSDAEHDNLPDGSGVAWEMGPKCAEMRMRNIRFTDLSPPAAERPLP